MKRPEPPEYPEYFKHYISLTRGVNALQNLEDSTLDLVNLFEGIPADKHHYRYEPSKWSIAQMIRHLIDADLVFTYRALQIARNPGVKLAGFDHESWAISSMDAKLAVPELLREFKDFRMFALSFFGGIEEAQWDLKGQVNGKTTSLRSIPFIMSGHALHHINILRERYL